MENGKRKTKTVKKPVKASSEEKEPNLIFVGRRETGSGANKKQIPLDPPAQLQIGQKTISLPDADLQKKGFYHEDAALIRRSFPALYKQFVNKGE